MLLSFFTYALRYVCVYFRCFHTYIGRIECGHIEVNMLFPHGAESAARLLGILASYKTCIPLQLQMCVYIYMYIVVIFNKIIRRGFFIDIFIYIWPRKSINTMKIILNSYKKYTYIYLKNYYKIIL